MTQNLEWYLMTQNVKWFRAIISDLWKNSNKHERCSKRRGHNLRVFVRIQGIYIMDLSGLKTKFFQGVFDFSLFIL